LDIENRTVRITPEKGSEPRLFKISTKLITMLTNLPKKSLAIFGGYPLRGFRRGYTRQRKRAANKLDNPRLNQITFHTFRHWKATMEYHKTKDILYVMRLLGHKTSKIPWSTHISSSLRTTNTSAKRPKILKKPASS